MNMFRDIHEQYEHRYDPGVSRAITDLAWYGSVRLGFIALACAILCGGWLLYGAESAAHAPEASGTPTSPINQHDLSAMIATLSARDTAYQALRVAPNTVVDPR